MRLAVLSDIHGNLIALDTVLEELANQSIDRYLCLGDVASSGPQPHAVLERLAGLDWLIVQGNTDDWLLNPQSYPGDDPFYTIVYEIAGWCASQLTWKDKIFLKTFKPVIELSIGEAGQLLAYHGSPRSYEDYIGANTSEQTIDEIYGSLPQQIFVGGHTHQQMLRRYHDALLINPGSVGLAYETLRPDASKRNVPWAEYAILHWEAGKLGVELCRLPLDSNAVKQAALDSAMPHADWWVKQWA